MSAVNAFARPSVPQAEALHMTIKSMTGFARADGRRGRSAGTGRCAPSTAAASTSGCACRPASRRWSRASARRGQARHARQPHRQPERQAQRRRTRRSGSTRRRCSRCWPRSTACRTTTEVAPPRAEALLGIKGVLEVVEPEESEAEMQARTEAMLASLDAALDGMVRAREAEGRRLEADRAGAAGDHRAPGGGGRRHRPRARPRPSASASRSRSGGCWRPAPASTRRASTRRRPCWRRAPTWRRS